MQPQRQPALFEVPSRPVGRVHKLGPEAERFLANFRAWRMAAVSLNAARAETSQLRSLTLLTGVESPELILDFPTSVARIIRGESDDATIGTNRKRFAAAVQLADFLEATNGAREAKDKLGAVMKELQVFGDKPWYLAGVAVGGRRSGPAKRAPTLTPVHLKLIADSAPPGKTLQAVRARTIVHLACFSGLRVSEIASLEWKSVELTGPGVQFTVVRNGRQKYVLGSEAAGSALEFFSLRGRRQYGPGFTAKGSGFVFPSQGRPGKAFTSEQVHNIIVTAATTAGFPTVRRRDLLSAFTVLLSERGFSDHAIRLALGVQQVSTVDGLLNPYHRLSAQRQLRERLEPLA